MFAYMIVAGAIACLGLSVSAADIWYVSQKNGNDTDATGDVSMPFKTIQAAINRAKDGDTVKVEPGTYNTSVNTSEDYGRSRIFIEKKITLESTGNRSNTIIEGAWHSSEDYGLGEDAIRCICATATCTIKGFTLRKGATQSGNDSDLTSGGGLLIPSKSECAVKIVDCSIEDCSSTRGGGMRRGTAYRTIFRNCYASIYGAAARQAALAFCYFDSCKGKHVTAYTKSLWHCTFYNNNVTAKDSYCVQADSKEFSVGNCVFVSGSANIGMVYSKTTESLKCSLDGSVFYGNIDVAFTKNEGSSVKDTAQENVLGAGVFSPLFGDMRPYKGGPLDGTGIVDIKAKIGDGYLDLDVEGNPVDWTEGKLCPGAFQTVVTPASGKTIFCNSTATLTVDGVEVGNAKATNYTHSTCWPTQYLVKASSSLPKYKIARIDMYVDGSSDISGRPPLNFDDEVWVTAPPSGISCAWMPYETDNVYYVDDDAQYEGDADGSEAKPYKTIAEAATKPNVRVICVKAGVYSSGTGGAKANGLNNRVQFDNNGYVRMIGVDRAENTFIVGEPDPKAKDDPDRLGCGPNAVRCVSSSVNGVIQGFTLTGGHSDYGKIEDDKSIEVFGGMSAIVNSGASKGMFFVDCIISNNVAYRASMGYGGTFLRCYFADNRTIRNDGGLKASVAANCIFSGNKCLGGAVRDSNTYVYNCTFKEDNPLGGVPFADCYVYNSICDGTRQPPKAAKDMTGSIMHGFSVSEGQAALEAEPGFRDAANRDLRVATASPAVGFGNPSVKDWWKMAGCDFYGNRYRFIDGKVISGAIQELVPSVRFGVSAGPESGISTSGIVFLDGQEESISVTAQDAGTRLYVGFSVNGDIVPDSEKNASFTYVWGESFPVPGDTVNAVYLTNWYVNASSGDDKNRGDTPGAAKETLAEAMKYVVEGDVVHAAEGTYEKGSMLQEKLDSSVTGSSDPYIRSRVVVPIGVQLVADGRREYTVIKGESDQNPNADDGCGPSAMRCVFANEKTLVKGFTLRGGKTDSQNLQDDNNWGGGVLACRTGTDAKLPTIEDCAIENCRSMRGGGAMYGLFRNCRFIGNTAKQGGTSEGAAARGGHYYGCYFDDSVCVAVLAYPVEVDCCTFGPRNLTTDKEYAPAIGSSQANDAETITGTLFCGELFTAGVARKLVNCAYRQELTLPEGVVAEECVVAPESELAQLDENGVPIPGMNPVCDQGAHSHWTAIALDAARDAAGNPRIANGAMDIGCYEADWKGVYSTTVGKRNSVAITNACAYAHKGEDSEVFLPEGALTGALIAAQKGRYEFPVRITGNGKLVVKIGDLVTEYTSSGVVGINLLAGTYDLSFGYIPGENDEGGVFICSGGRIFGSSIVIR